MRQRERHTFIKERRRKEKCESMMLEISISFDRLTPETWRSRYRHPFMIAEVSYYNSE